MAEAHGGQGLSGFHGMGHDFRGQLYIFQGGQIGHQIIELEDEAHVIAAVVGPLVAGVGGDVLAVNPNLPLAGGVHAPQNVEQRGLAGTGSSQYNDQLALLDVKIQVFVSRNLPLTRWKVFTTIFYFNIGHAVTSFLLP